MRLTRRCAMRSLLPPRTAPSGIRVSGFRFIRFDHYLLFKSDAWPTCASTTNDGRLPAIQPIFLLLFPYVLPFFQTNDQVKNVVKVSLIQYRLIKCRTQQSTASFSRSFIICLSYCVKIVSSGSHLWELDGSQVIDARSFCFIFLCYVFINLE